MTWRPDFERAVYAFWVAQGEEVYAHWVAAYSPDLEPKLPAHPRPVPAASPLEREWLDQMTPARIEARLRRAGLMLDEVSDAG
jgi:hypothetical protein